MNAKHSSLSPTSWTRMRKIFYHLILGILALYLATILVPGVSIESPSEQFLKTLILAGLVLGLINFFLKPIVKLITFPLRILTLGFFSLIINMLMVWLIDILFPQLVILGFWPLFWTGLLSSGLNFVLIKKK